MKAGRSEGVYERQNSSLFNHRTREEECELWKGVEMSYREFELEYVGCEKSKTFWVEEWSKVSLSSSNLLIVPSRCWRVEPGYTETDLEGLNPFIERS